NTARMPQENNPSKSRCKYAINSCLDGANAAVSEPAWAAILPAKNAVATGKNTDAARSWGVRRASFRRPERDSCARRRYRLAARHKKSPYGTASAVRAPIPTTVHGNDSPDGIKSAKNESGVRNVIQRRGPAAHSSP